jgi:hypothetical protein
MGNRPLETHLRIVGRERDVAIRFDNIRTVFRTDAGNFNRFLTSLGLLFMGVGLAAPYFYFRNTDTLTISQQEVNGLTATGRAAIESRQHAIALLEPWVVVASVAIALAGLGLLLWGATRLQSAQEKEDEESDLRRRRAQLEYEEMSPAEQAAKNAEQAVVEVEEEQAHEPSLPEDSPLGPSWGLLRWVMTGRRAEVITRISTAVEQVFHDREVGPFEPKFQVRVGAADRKVRLDGIFEAAEPGRRDIILKVQVVPDARTLSTNGQNRANELIGALAQYETLTARRANGWIVAVIPKEADQELDEDAYTALESLRTFFHQWGEVTLVREQEIEELPNAFLQTFYSA